MIDKLMKSKVVEKAIQQMFDDYEVSVKSVAKNFNKGVYKVIATDENTLGIISVEDLVDKFDYLLNSQNFAESVLTNIGGVGDCSLITSKDTPLLYSREGLEEYIKEYFFCFTSELDYYSIIEIEGKEYFIYYDYFILGNELGDLICIYDN